ncbi:hypothetical protein D1007_23384 [Hordeum vulgare]|nr:hypothetical protein D1007_23384 [Hordeum vulgare]
MAILKKNTSFAVAALVVVMAATLLLSSCDARKEKMDKLTAFPVPAKCYSRYFPNCTEPRCKKFCFQPIPGAVCTDKNTCCCPIA